jgi:hypothetical protein
VKKTCDIRTYGDQWGNRRIRKLVLGRQKSVTGLGRKEKRALRGT